MTEGADVNATSSAGPPLLWAAGMSNIASISVCCSTCDLALKSDIRRL